MDNTNIVNSKQMVIAELQNTETLFQRLAEAREEIKSSKNTRHNDGSRKYFWMGNLCAGFSLTGICTILISYNAAKFLSPLLAAYLQTPALVGLGLMLAILLFSLLPLFASIVLDLRHLVMRSESERAQDTYQTTFAYLEQGGAIAGDFELTTLEGVEDLVKDEIARLDERTSVVDAVLLKLPSAAIWLALLLLVVSLIDARQLGAILSSPAVSGLAQFQEQLTNHIFSATVTSFHPLVIFDVLMYALVFTVAIKVQPVLINIAASRRLGRQKDYLKIIGQAKRFKKLIEEKAAASERAVSPLPALVIQAEQAEAIN